MSRDTREKVRALLARGWTQAAVARELGLAPATISHHAGRLGIPRWTACARRYDWGAVQAFYDTGRSVKECLSHFGMSSKTFADAVHRGAVVTRPQATPIEQFLVAGTKRGRWNLKRRLIALGLKQDRCEACGIEEWRGRALTMALHHVNGDGHDNRLENLQLLCPNCHSQTDNFAGRAAAGRRARG